VSTSIELMLTTQTLMAEISDLNFRQHDIAVTYEMALASSEETDWQQVNAAIIKRWSFAGLERIKKQAWKRLEAKPKGKEVAA